MMRHALSLLLAFAVSVPLSAQTIRIAPAAVSPVTDADVLVLHEYEKLTGQPFGTMSMRYVTEIRQRAGALLDIAIVEPGFSSAYMTRESALAASRPDAVHTAKPRLIAGEATFNALSLLRIQPALGRDFTEADVLAGRHVALLTASAAERLFGRREDALGKLLWTSEKRAPLAHEVVGVLPAGVMTSTPELDPNLEVILLLPSAFDTPLPDENAFAPVVRLKSGVTLDAAKVAIDDAVAAAQRAIASPNYGGFGARLDTLRR